MVSNKSKWVRLTVAICFAILQALQPFIHTHVDSDYSSHHSGFHVGDDHEGTFTFSEEHFDDHEVYSQTDASHTVSVDASLKHESNGAPLMKVSVALVLILCFVLHIQLTHRLNPAFLLISKESLRRRLPASRAPPQL